MLFILIKAIPGCTFAPITTTLVHILVIQKWRKLLILTICDNFRYF